MVHLSCDRLVADTDSLFCHQFIAGPEFVEGLEGWNRLVVTDQLRITSHPELEIRQVTRGDTSVTLLGHMLDSDNPVATNLQILERLAQQFDTIDVLVEACAPYGGRWLIIAVKGDARYLFNDTLGLRQVFYTDVTLSKSLWLVSQPGLAQKLFNLDLDSRTRSFIDSPQFSLSPERAWPAYSTPFPQVRHLLPNHYLDMGSRVHHRYWPKRPVAAMSSEDAVEDVARRLQNILTAAVNRFDDVVLGMTAGLDSRLVLAAAKNLSDRIGYATVRQSSMAATHPDLAVPAALLRQLDLPHNVIQTTSPMSNRFSDMFRESVFLAHDHYGPDAEAIFNSYKRKKVVITGSGAEVGRCPYRKKLSQLTGSVIPDSAITAQVLAALDNKPESEYAISRFNEWLAGIDETYGVSILDLFAWENGHGNWLAMTQLEFDIAWREIITPYNCRSILTAMLAVDEADRGPPEYRLFHSLIRTLWPEVLREPINPAPQRRRNLPHYIKRVIRRSMSLLR